MTSVINEYLIHIRTEDCTKLNGTLNSYLSFILKPAIGVVDTKNTLSAKLSTAEIPYSFYTVNAYNNTFNIVENGTPRLITITKGSYDIFEFRDLIGTLLGSNFTVSVSINTGKMTIINSSLTTIGLTFISDAFKLLGFSNITYSGSGATGLTSPNIISLFSITGIYLKSNLSGYNIYNTRLNNNLSSILQLIQIEEDAFNMINYRSTTDAYISKLNDKKIDELVFRITDAEDNLIDFNGIDFEFTLKVFENKNILSQPLQEPIPSQTPNYTLPLEPLNNLIDTQRIENILKRIQEIK